MGLFNWVALVITGGFSRIESQAAAQPAAPLPLPATIQLGDRDVTLRLLTPDDRDAILAFARSLPPEDLLFLRRDVTREEEVDAWIRDTAAGLSQTVLALADDQPVGYAAVILDQAWWNRHVAELRVQIAPALRGRGLGRILTAQAFALAKQQGVRKMLAQMTVEQEAARRAFERMGFASEAILRRQVMDREGRLHDLRIMSIDLEEFRLRVEAARSRSDSSSLPV